MEETLLEVNDLQTSFFTFRCVVPAVDGVTFSVCCGESLGLVGESGSGKTVTGMSILKLIQPPGKIIGGDIRFKGESLLTMAEDELREIRGAKISMIFQNPKTCLNPVLTIGEQIDRVFIQHQKSSQAEAKERRLDMLNRVRIGDPQGFSKSYPHQLSGGMCQRAMIVMAIICNPELLIADEPTTGLDVTVQRQIMELLQEMRATLNATQILVTHDLGVVAESCDQVVVMYSGKIMEIAPTKMLFRMPVHPYTRGLLESIPRLDRKGAPALMPGNVPNPAYRPKGCPFNPRCPLAQDICRAEFPNPEEIEAGHTVACHYAKESINTIGTALFKDIEMG